MKFWQALTWVEPEQLIETAKFAEEVGFDGCMLGDHGVYPRDIAAGLEDLRDREELRVAGRVAFARYWSLFGSGVVNLTDRREDPSLTSDGFEPLRTRVGIAYQDDCLDLSLTWRRDFVATGDAKKGNTFEVHFSFRNLGFR